MPLRWSSDICKCCSSIIKNDSKCKQSKQTW
jgi:hypothetical protein